ncbi:MAG: tRNA (adenosine(37)-N6)-threonylcarbamoyltransferase complex transferase subunit TsaD [Candidatus Tectomicrobia bacterium]|nr:tRNA (adenosine(37)-N6)-threonylcarbamoyltransferase complex transferase subunit TsaD [Candidatus Tectomicrobia bacterium]
MLVLALETSCDETAAGIVEDGCRIRANVVASQIELHRSYGGVVPELACRSHLTNLPTVIDAALEEAGVRLAEIDVLAATLGPGLIGALLVGLSMAKAMAFALRKPLVGVNHLAGHIYAAFLTQPPPTFPFVALVVSGGHTDLYLVAEHGCFQTLGRTRDDAAGEAFDKVAKLLALGYPGGPIIDRLATRGRPDAVAFPRAMLAPGNYEFSFSGLKTAVRQHLLRAEEAAGLPVEDIAASFQEAVIDVLVTKTMDAVQHTGVRSLAVVGGVAANSGLRGRLAEVAARQGVQLTIPPPELCTDNAAMCASAAYYCYRAAPERVAAGEGDAWLRLDAKATLPLRSWSTARSGDGAATR